MSTQTAPYTINTTRGVTPDDIRVARDAADLDATATAAPDLTALREAVEAWRFICNRYDRELEGYGEVQRAEHDVLIAADALALWYDTYDGARQPVSALASFLYEDESVESEA